MVFGHFLAVKYQLRKRRKEIEEEKELKPIVLFHRHDLLDQFFFSLAGSGNS